MLNATRFKEVYDMCLAVAQAFHPQKEEYAVRSAKLMTMTTLHESQGLLYRRQKGFGKANYTAGAYGLFQTEWIAVLDNLKWLAKHRDILERGLELVPNAHTRRVLVRCVDAHAVLLREWKKQKDYASPNRVELLTLLQTTEGDVVGAILCRTHYMRQPGSVPVELPKQAAYAKEYYNTSEGAATVEDYLRAAERAFPIIFTPEKESDNAVQPYVEEANE